MDLIQYNEYLKANNTDGNALSNNHEVRKSRKTTVQKPNTEKKVYIVADKNGEGTLSSTGPLNNLVNNLPT